MGVSDPAEAGAAGVDSTHILVTLAAEYAAVGAQAVRRDGGGEPRVNFPASPQGQAILQGARLLEPESFDALKAVLRLPFEDQDLIKEVLDLKVVKRVSIKSELEGIVSE